MYGAVARRAVISVGLTGIVMTIGLLSGALAAQADTAELRSLATHTELVTTLASQAIVFALDTEAGVVEPAQAHAASDRLAAGIASLRSEAGDTGMTPALAIFVHEAEEILVELEDGDTGVARQRFAGRLVDAFDDHSVEATWRLRRLASRAQVLRLGALVGGVVALAAAGVIAVRAVSGRVAPRRRVRRGRHTAAAAASNTTRLVIHLDDDPSDLSMRQRFPRVQDLEWLLVQTLRPFEQRGWSVDITCPDVGVDCDPVHLREALGGVLVRAEAGGAERIAVVVRVGEGRVRIMIADDGASVFGPEGLAVGADPVVLRSAIPTPPEASPATLTWGRQDDLNIATFELPRLDRAREVVS